MVISYTKKTPVGIQEARRRKDVTYSIKIRGGEFLSLKEVIDRVEGTSLKTLFFMIQNEHKKKANPKGNKREILILVVGERSFSRPPLIPQLFLSNCNLLSPRLESFFSFR